MADIFPNYSLVTATHKRIFANLAAILTIRECTVQMILIQPTYYELKVI